MPIPDPQTKLFMNYFRELTEGPVAQKFWSCVMDSVWLTDQRMMQEYGQRTRGKGGARKLQARHRPQVDL